MLLVWKKIKKIGKCIPDHLVVFNINDVVVADAKTVANAFANHFPGLSEKADDKPFAEYKAWDKQHLDILPLEKKVTTTFKW